MTIGRYQRTNRPIPIISKTANTDYPPIIGASLLESSTWEFEQCRDEQNQIQLPWVQQAPAVLQPCGSHTTRRPKRTP